MVADYDGGLRPDTSSLSNITPFSDADLAVVPECHEFPAYVSICADHYSAWIALMVVNPSGGVKHGTVRYSGTPATLKDRLLPRPLKPPRDSHQDLIDSGFAQFSHIRL